MKHIYCTHKTHKYVSYDIESLSHSVHNIIVFNFNDKKISYTINWHFGVNKIVNVRLENTSYKLTL